MRIYVAEIDYENDCAVFSDIEEATKHMTSCHCDAVQIYELPDGATRFTKAGNITRKQALANG